MEDLMAKVGRPKIEISDIDWEKIKELCKIQCTTEEVASVMGMNYDTLNARCKEKYDVNFSEVLKSWAEGGKTSLRRWQWKACEKGNTTMLIWMGKIHLDQREKVEQKVTTHDGDQKKIDELAEILQQSVKRV